MISGLFVLRKTSVFWCEWIISFFSKIFQILEKKLFSPRRRKKTMTVRKFSYKKCLNFLLSFLIACSFAHLVSPWPKSLLLETILLPFSQWAKTKAGYFVHFFPEVATQSSKKKQGSILLSESKTMNTNESISFGNNWFCSFRTNPDSPKSPKIHVVKI